jgi:hypothetical protein
VHHNPTPGWAIGQRVAEIEIGLFMTELIQHRGPWKGL